MGRGTKRPLKVALVSEQKEKSLCFRKDPYVSCAGTVMDPSPRLKHATCPAHNSIAQ